MSSSKGIWFVYRSHYDGPLSKRVRRLSAPSVVDWFAGKMKAAQKSAKPGDVADAELGGTPYGLETIFEAAKKEKLTPPKTTAALEKLLKEHLYVEGSIRLDAKGLRVKTDDDEVDLAYFFFDDAVAKKHKDRLAYLLYTCTSQPRLPEGDAEGRFKPPMEIDPLRPPGKGKGTTYACLFTFEDSESMPGSAHAFQGVRLPDLIAHLQQVTPYAKQASWSKEYMESWPLELRLLRAMVQQGDRDLAPALSKCAAWPVMSASGPNASHAGLGSAADAVTEFAAVAKELSQDGNPKKTIVQVSAHAALLCAHATKSFGYQQWILFDDRWACAHPDLASSILRYASGWDPFAEGDDDDDDDDDDD